MPSQPSRLLAVFAHPDDEAFGVAGSLAAAAARGVQVTLVSATRGEVGEISDPTLATSENLGEVREGELRAAARELGVTDVRFLGYRDSGMAGTPDNDDARAFAQANAEEVVGRLVGLLEELQPSVVLTFEPGGGYGHPDHVAISRHMTAAFDRAADGAARLYYTAIPRSVLRAWLERARAENNDPGPFRDIDPERVGTPDHEITTVVDVRPWLAQKTAALAEHATQIRADNPLRELTPEQREAILGREHFVQVRGPRADLLDGLV